MKLNRLIEITTILLNKKTVTAAELAERFQVSPRTIYRDIEVLSGSGIPIYCVQGAGGGISLMEEYTINRASLSTAEKDSILFALNTLRATRYPDIEKTIEKLGGLFKSKTGDWIQVDFSPWNCDIGSDNKFSRIQSAILEGRQLEIEYITAQNRKSRRVIQPLRLCFKSQAWYLWAFCTTRMGYRLFRISRIISLCATNDFFDRTKRIEESSEESQRYEAAPMNAGTRLVLEFTSESLYRLYDDFDYNSIKLMPDGKYRVEVSFIEDEWVYGYILSFGSLVRVIEPTHIIEIIKKRAQSLLEQYL